MISVNISIASQASQQVSRRAHIESPVPKLTTLKELSDLIKMDRSAARRYVLRLGVEPKRARTASSGYQSALVFTPEQVAQVVGARTADGYC
jgi:hypothetical protein